MAKKRRTKKDKTNPNRPISVSWKPTSSEAEFSDSEASVKGQLLKPKPEKASKKKSEKHARYSGENASLASVKKDLTKSLFFASLIVASEMMIYLIWY